MSNNMQGVVEACRTGRWPDGGEFNLACQPTSGKPCKNPVFYGQTSGRPDEMERLADPRCAYHIWYEARFSA